MGSEELGDELLRFIDQCIDTVPHLEALLLMWQSAPQAWSVEQLAARIYVTPATAKTILDDFVRRGLVNAANGAYAFDPAWDAQRQILSRLAAAYAKQLTRIATLIHSKGSRSVRDFARAFKLKEEK